MVTLNYREAGPIYEQIAEDFRQKIADGILQPGEKLPSVRELAAELTINPNTIQRAYRELESGGWVESQAGRGCFVQGIPGQNRQDALLRQLDETVATLRAMGISEEMLLAHIRKGGEDHA